MTPASIRLSTNQLIITGTDAYGPVTYLTPNVLLIVEVLGLSGEPIPNQQVTISNLSGHGTLASETILTGADGRGYTQYYAPSLLTNFSTQVPLYNPVIPAEGADYETIWNDTSWLYHNVGAAPNVFYGSDHTTVLVNEYILDPDLYADQDDMLANMYLFGGHSNDDLLAYSAVTRSGGRKVVYYQDVSGTNTLVSPDSFYEPDPATGQVGLVFASDLPCSYPGSSNYYEDLQYYWIVSSVACTFQATTTTRGGAVLYSNELTLRIDIPDIAKGQWTLPQASQGIWSGSMISSKLVRTPKPLANCSAFDIVFEL